MLFMQCINKLGVDFKPLQLKYQSNYPGTCKEEDPRYESFSESFEKRSNKAIEMKCYLYMFSKYSPWHCMQHSILSNHFECAVRHSSLDKLRRSSSCAATAASGDSNWKTNILSFTFRKRKKSRSHVQTVGWMKQSLYSWFHQKHFLFCVWWWAEALSCRRRIPCRPVFGRSVLSVSKTLGGHFVTYQSAVTILWLSSGTVAIRSLVWKKEQIIFFLHSKISSLQ